MKLDNYDNLNYIATWHFDGFDVKYNGGAQGYDYHLNYNGLTTNVSSFTLLDIAGGTPLTINPLINSNYEEDDWWTAHDVTIQSTSDSPLQWTAGGFYYYQHYNQPYEVSDPLQPQLAQPVFGGPGGPNAAPNPAHDILYLDYDFTVESVAGYGQASYKFNDQWKITGNIRYNFDDKFGTESARYLYFGNNILSAAVPIGVGPGGVPITAPLAELLGANTPSLDITASQTCLSGNPKIDPVTGTSDCGTAAHGLGRGVTSMGIITPSGYAYRDLGVTSDAVTGGADIEWTPTPDIFTYFRYGRGYASPSFNAGQVLANPEVGAEFLNSYEIGYKQSFGKSLLIDLAAFYYDYDELQLPISIANGGVIQSNFVNVPKAISEGIEFEGYWSPIKDLLITASYSFDHSSLQTGCSGTLNAGVLTPRGRVAVPHRHQRPCRHPAGRPAIPRASWSCQIPKREGQSAA